jgi:hypothetical protein
MDAFNGDFNQSIVATQSARTLGVSRKHDSPNTVNYEYILRPYFFLSSNHTHWLRFFNNECLPTLTEMLTAAKQRSWLSHVDEIFKKADSRQYKIHFENIYSRFASDETRVDIIFDGENGFYPIETKVFKNGSVASITTYEISSLWNGLDGRAFLYPKTAYQRFYDPKVDKPYRIFKYTTLSCRINDIRDLAPFTICTQSDLKGWNQYSDFAVQLNAGNAPLFSNLEKLP